MSRFVFASHFVFIATILFPGCTAPAHLTHTSAALTQEEKMQQTINAWKGTHISKAIQKWGSPNEVSDDGTGWHTYIWQVPIHGFLAGQESRMQGFLPRQDHPDPSPTPYQRHARSKWNILFNRLYLPIHVLYTPKWYNLQNTGKTESRCHK